MLCNSFNHFIAEHKEQKTDNAPQDVVNNIIDIENATSRNQLCQLYEERQHKPYFNGIPYMLFLQSASREEANGEKHQHIHNQLGKNITIQFSVAP